MLTAWGSSNATVVVQGDLDLQRALEPNIDEWAVAFNELATMKSPLVDLAARSMESFAALGNIRPSGAACVAQGISEAAGASASFSVSVQASAAFSASSM